MRLQDGVPKPKLPSAFLTFWAFISPEAISHPWVYFRTLVRPGLLGESSLIVMLLWCVGREISLIVNDIVLLNSVDMELWELRTLGT